MGNEGHVRRENIIAKPALSVLGKGGSKYFVEGLCYLADSQTRGQLTETDSWLLTSWEIRSLSHSRIVFFKLLKDALALSGSLRMHAVASEPRQESRKVHCLTRERL